MIRASCRYASRYCEENVWHLARADELASLPRSALFITNESRSCALWQQRSSDAPQEPVLWDYHVVLVVHRAPAELYDLDSRLPFPCPASTYLSQTFPLAGRLPPELEPRFRLVPQALFAARFASDRSHMRSADGTWHAPPPPWPAIQRPDRTMTLMEFVDLRTPDLGEVYDLPGLRARLAREEERA